MIKETTLQGLPQATALLTGAPGAAHLLPGAPSLLLPSPPCCHLQEQRDPGATLHTHYPAFHGDIPGQDSSVWAAPRGCSLGGTGAVLLGAQGSVTHTLVSEVLGGAKMQT